ncbi:hypothetical protein Fcan01_19801 [Folsomia candida]|uniref:Uncharacterized protein n=1 Tax=Folsomia candida TaxID=158441 RepID=A0A226DH72_FOLCA|nr:hypothetical protein Fcan01_19801 [Folsomia candida]
MEQEGQILDCRLSLPSNIFLISKSNAGKTSLLKVIHKKRHEIFKEPITRTIFVYDGPMGQFEEFIRENPEVEFAKEIPQIPHDSTDKILLLIDDEMQRLSGQNNKLLNEIVTKFTHHVYKGATIISQQTLYPKNFSVATSQANVFILFPNRRNWRSIEYLNSQVFPEQKHFLRSCLLDVAQTPYGFLVVDVENLENGGVRNFLWDKLDSKVYSPS